MEKELLSSQHHHHVQSLKEILQIVCKSKFFQDYQRSKAQSVYVEEIQRLYDEHPLWGGLHNYVLKIYCSFAAQKLNNQLKFIQPDCLNPPPTYLREQFSGYTEETLTKDTLSKIKSKANLIISAMKEEHNSQVQEYLAQKISPESLVKESQQKLEVLVFGLYSDAVCKYLNSQQSLNSVLVASPIESLQHGAHYHHHSKKHIFINSVDATQSLEPKQLLTFWENYQLSKENCIVLRLFDPIETGFSDKSQPRKIISGLKGAHIVLKAKIFVEDQDVTVHFDKESQSMLHFVHEYGFIDEDAVDISKS